MYLHACLVAVHSATGIDELHRCAGAPAERLDQPQGQGLALLDALTSRWGVERVAAGKTVWYELG